MFTIKTIQFIPLLVFILLPSISHASTSLELKCVTIPNFKDELCVATTASPNGPYDDVVIYRKKKDKSLVLLGSNNGEVGVFNGFGFSVGGELMWESWAEEGHPHHSFYKTEDYLSGTTTDTYVTGIGDYNFSHIREFRDDGFLIYASDAEGDECQKTKGQPASIVEVHGTDEYIYIA